MLPMCCRSKQAGTELCARLCREDRLPVLGFHSRLYDPRPRVLDLGTCSRRRAVGTDNGEAGGAPGYADRKIIEVPNCEPLELGVTRSRGLHATYVFIHQHLPARQPNDASLPLSFRHPNCRLRQPAFDVVTSLLQSPCFYCSLLYAIVILRSVAAARLGQRRIGRKPLHPFYRRGIPGASGRSGLALAADRIAVLLNIPDAAAIGHRKVSEPS